MSLYNIISPASLVPGQPEDVSQVLANFQAIQSVLNGGIDDVNIRSTAGIVPSKFAGYPSDVTKGLRGDGTWITEPRFTVGTLATGPPTSPSDGDVWVATGVDANGTTWQFRYNAGSASTYKWEFIGGSSLNSVVTTSQTCNSISGQDLATIGPLVTLVRAGDYFFRFGATVMVNTAGYGAILVPVASSGTPSMDGNVWKQYFPTAGVIEKMMGAVAITGNTAGGIFKLMYTNYGSGIISTWTNRHLECLPIRVA